MISQKMAFGQLIQAEAEYLSAYGWKPEKPIAPGAPIWWTSPYSNESHGWADAVHQQRLRCNTSFGDVGEMERVACVVNGYDGDTMSKVEDDGS